MTAVTDSKTTLPVGGEIAAPGVHSGALRRLLEEECFVVLALSLTLVAVAVAAPASMIVPDTWLALVDGRWIDQHGLPHTDAITLWTRGTEWVDQQWLAHLFFYGVSSAGGTKLVLLVALAIDVLAVCLAAYAVRKGGASQRSTALCLLTAFLVAPWLLQARTKTLALPMFVAVFPVLCGSYYASYRDVFGYIPANDEKAP
jgi:hypothetical protein